MSARKSGTTIATKRGAKASRARELPELPKLAAALRVAGLRRTAPRVAVLERLASASAPMSHGDVAKDLADAGLDRATVYRNLMDLVEAGLVVRADLGDHVWRFEVARGDGPSHGAEHPHFVCTECGDVACLPDGAVRLFGGKGRPRAISDRAVEVHVRGRCDGCARA